jgi:hypothetical protein
MRRTTAVQEEQYIGVIVCGDRKDDKAIRKTIEPCTMEDICGTGNLMVVLRILRFKYFLVNGFIFIVRLYNPCTSVQLSNKLKLRYYLLLLLFIYCF